MKRLLFCAVVVAICGLITGPASASKGGGSGNLKCFSGAPATCTVSSSGSTVTLDTHNGGYAGAYLTNTRNSGAALTSVDYTFNYNCDPVDDSASCVGGGSPRWSIPIDTNGDSKTDGYAFLDAAGCGSDGVVSTTEADCGVNFQGADYASWDSFAAAHPTYTIANALPFVITDTTEPGTTLISAISVTRS